MCAYLKSVFTMIAVSEVPSMLLTWSFENPIVLIRFRIITCMCSICGQAELRGSNTP